jgi:N-acetylmuramic acid 6-phosphate etherase
MTTDPPLSLSAPETEQINPATTDIDRMSAAQIAQLMNAEDATVAGAVEKTLPQIARAIDAIVERLRRGGRLIYLGAGTSGRLGALDASECPPTFNTPPDLVIGWVAGGPDALTWSAEDVEDSAEAGSADAERLAVGEQDVLVGIAASGRTPYVLGALAYARKRGALTVGLTCNTGTLLEIASDLVIAPVVGPEVIAGSTRLKAGTAQKMVLNILSTGTMILLGKTFGNLMVDVHAANAKLRRRALAIVQRATGLDETAAAALLSACGGDTKTAVLAGCAGVEPAVARERLAAYGGSLRTALDAVP